MNDEPVMLKFDDGKEPDALRTIGEVARALGIRQHVLRYWEEQFPMLRPVKRSGGRRYYRPDDIRMLAAIDRLVHHQGYTLRGARLALEGGVTAPPPTTQTDVHAQPASADLVPALMAIRNRLAAALEAS